MILVNRRPDDDQSRGYLHQRPYHFSNLHLPDYDQFTGEARRHLNEPGIAGFHGGAGRQALSDRIPHGRKSHRLPLTVS